MVALKRVVASSSASVKFCRYIPPSGKDFLEGGGAAGLPTPPDKTAGLQVEEPGIEAVLGQQLGMRPFFDDFALVEDEDPVGIQNR